MRKVTLKLDAICAKLKKGLGEEEDASPELHKLKKDSLDKELNHNAIRSEETGETIPAPLSAPQNVGMQEDLDNGSDTQDGYLDTNNHIDDINVQSQEKYSSLYFNSSFDADTASHRDTPVLDCVESETRTSTPKSLSGASKRKSRGGAGLPARRPVPGLTPGDDAEENSNSERSLSSLPNGTKEGLLDGADASAAATAGRDEDDAESQGSNANISMQSLPDSRLTAVDNLDLKEVDSNNENDDFEDSVTHSTTNGAMDTASFNDEDDESDPWGDSNASQDPWEDDNDDDDDVSYPDSEHSGGAQRNDLKAIREYAERSAWDNEETPEIEDGLASNDVITDVEVPSVNTSNSKDRATVIDASSLAQDKSQHQQHQFPVPVLPFSVQSLQNLPPPPSYDAATMSHPRYDQKAVKEYATDTMKELLGMYGYEEAGKDIDKHVPDTFNFSKYMLNISCFLIVCLVHLSLSLSISLSVCYGLSLKPLVDPF